MYDYNNKDKTIGEGLNDWYLTKSTWNQRNPLRTHPYTESRVMETLRSIWENIKPHHSWRGKSKYHN